MAHVRRVVGDRGKKWECRWSFPDPGDPDKRKFQKQRFRTEKEAKAKAREIEQKQASGLDVDHTPGKESLGEWAERWFAEYQRSVKPSTARKSRGLLDATILPHFANTPVRRIKTSDVGEWLHKIEVERRIAPPTIKHHYLVLSNVLRYAATNHAIPVNPAIGVRLPTNRTRGRLAREPRFLTPQQVAKLADALPYPYDLLAQFMAYTGLRVGEVAGLNIEDVDLVQRKVRVGRTRTKIKGGAWEVHTPKSGKTRTTPLPHGIATAMAGYVAQHPHGDEPTAPLWPGRKIAERSAKGNKGGLDYDSPWDRSVFYRRHFGPVLKQVEGVPNDLRLHDLRHTFASICASSGVPAAQVAEWMGHQNEIVTRTIYTHLFKEDTTRYEDALSAAFRPGGDSGNVVPFPRAN